MADGIAFGHIDCQQLDRVVVALTETAASCSVEIEANLALEMISDSNSIIAITVSVFFTALTAAFIGASAYFIREELSAAKVHKIPSKDMGRFLSYRVDYLFSTYRSSKPVLLTWMTLSLILIGGVIMRASAIFIDYDEDMHIFRALWLSWTFIADPGNHTDQETAGGRFISVCLTICGMLVFALVISIVSESISEYVDGMKKGNSRVFESNHTLVVGWGDKMVPILNQIAIANESEGGDYIVVLTEQDKEECEEFLAQMIDKGDLILRGSTLVCRSGSPLLIPNLMRVSAAQARSIVVLAATEVSADETDGYAVRVLLCLKKMNIKGYAVVEVRDIDNEGLLKMVAPEICESVVSHDMIGRVMLYCSRQPGLTNVLEALIGFEGDEFYLSGWPQLTGRTFRDAHFAFPDAMPIGIHRASAAVGVHELNPSDSSVIQEGDKLIVIAEDDDTYTYVEPPKKLLRQVSPPQWEIPVAKPEHVLFCGWRRDIDDIVVELDSLVVKGSSLTILTQLSDEDRLTSLVEGGLDVSTLKNLKLIQTQGNIISRSDLSALPLEKYGSVLVFAEENLELQMTISDSRSLTCLLILQDIQKRRAQEAEYSSMAGGRHGKGQMILCEMLDVSTRALVALTGVSDYVLSNELVGKAMAQVAEDRQINGVFKELLSIKKNNILLRDIRNFAKPSLGRKASFYDIMRVARMRKEVAIGYVSAEKGTEGVVHINPRRKAEPQCWPAGTAVIVMAQD